MTHAFYIYNAYGLAALVIAGLIAYTWADGRARQKELAALEDAGIHRRSQQPTQVKNGSK